MIGVIAFGAQRFHLLHGQPEYEGIFRPDFIQNFHVGPIEGSNGKGSVQRQLHISRSRGLFARR